MKLFSVPKEIENVTGALQEAGFQAYLVGGCVRDMVRVEKPKDWDVATDATPDKIQKIFPHAFYENEFGTVGVVNDPSTGSGQAIDETLKVVEVTPFRIEGEIHGRKASGHGALEQTFERRFEAARFHDERNRV